jgi:NTP pyrophosphatase (non-canonical NTP hydrolase)
MKRLFCVIFVLLLLLAFAIPVSAEETECLHDKYPGALPVGGVVMKFKPVDSQKHAAYYVCETCEEEITFSLNNHYIHEYDVRCDCGITRAEIAALKYEEEKNEACKHENTEHRYDKHLGAVALEKHIKLTFCLDCEKYIDSVEEAHEASVDGVCVYCLQEGLKVEPPIEEPPAEEPPIDDTVTLPLPDIEVPKEAVTMSDKIVGWIKENLEEISVICTLILTVFYQARKHIVLNKSIATMNNNAITVAEKSDSSISKALEGVQAASTTVGGYVEAMNELLSEVRRNANEKQKLEAKLDEVTRVISTAKLANVEFANELAELLVLANIPNAKKEELYSRHRAAVHAIAAAEETEVKADVEAETGEE